MLSVGLLLVLILIVIFIIYTYIFIQGVEYEIISKSTIDIKKITKEKMILYYTNYLDMKDNIVYVLYYPLPINSIYWTIGFHKDNECLDSVNMGKYKTTEKGDILAILICNNNEALNITKNIIMEKHEQKNPHRKLIFHTVKMVSDFYIYLESYSNKFINCDISMRIKRYKFDNINYEYIKDTIFTESQYRKCENVDFFNKAKSTVINEKDQKINVNINTKEINSPLECFTNRSENILYDKNKTYKIITVDHFRSRAALHSHLIFYDSETNLPIGIEITGEISERLNKIDEISIRYVTFKTNVNIEKFYIVEHIYYDFVSGGKVNINTIIPMEIYITE
jgi:hypothetical protein